MTNRRNLLYFQGVAAVFPFQTVEYCEGGTGLYTPAALTPSVWPLNARWRPFQPAHAPASYTRPGCGRCPKYIFWMCAICGWDPNAIFVKLFPNVQTSLCLWCKRPGYRPGVFPPPHGREPRHSGLGTAECPVPAKALHHTKGI